MSEDTQNPEVENELSAEEQEYQTLKARAELLNLKPRKNWTLETLRAKVNEAVTSDKPANVATEAAAPETKKKVLSEKDKMRREANKLVRVIVTCMNPNKRDYAGEMISVANSLFEIKKFIQFGKPYHVPQAILTVLEERKFQAFEKFTDRKGNDGRRGKLMPEFAIQYLDPISPKELDDIRQRQLLQTGDNN